MPVNTGRHSEKMTCTICNSFKGKGNLTSIARDRHHVIPKFTWDEILHSVNSCYCCSILVSGCRGCFHQHGIREADILHGSLYFYYPSSTNNVQQQDISKVVIFSMENGQHFEVELFATKEPEHFVPDSWDYMPAWRRTSPQTHSEMALATIKSWIAECITTHYTPESFCNSPEQPYLPKRVVDVGLDDGIVKLVEPNGTKGKYICLSHCWGLTQIVTTTKVTLEDRKKGIASECLSQTIRDAISLTRALRIKYIWIDSLCIVQDDSRDWDIESSKMASVYSNGYLTIAATYSANSDGGLFSHTEDFEVAGRTPEGENYRLYFRERIDHHIDMCNENNKFIGKSTAAYYPLLTRAWVYQERMLSTRIIHFGRYETFFECRSSIRCECGNIEFQSSSPDTLRALIKIEYADTLWDYDTFYSQQYHAGIQYRGASLWRTIVCCYTALLLTKSSDRLPAIGGLAKDLAARRKSKYLAGLWEETLNDDLLWTVRTPSKYKKPRPRPRNGPTWSWASVETYVLYWDEILFTTLEEEGIVEERPPYQHFSNIEQCEVSWSAVDEFGSIAHGLLTISGVVVKGMLERQVELRDGLEDIVHYVSFPNMRLAMKTDYLLDHHGPDQTTPGTEVFCLRMSCIQEGLSDNLISLVLKESPEFHGCFERIGILVIQAKPPPIDPVGGVFQAAKLRTVTII